MNMLSLREVRFVAVLCISALGFSAQAQESDPAIR